MLEDESFNHLVPPLFNDTPQYQTHKVHNNSLLISSIPLNEFLRSDPSLILVILNNDLNCLISNLA